MLTKEEKIEFVVRIYRIINKLVKEKSIKDRLFDNGDENEDYVKIHKKNKKETKNSVNLVAS